MSGTNGRAARREQCVLTIPKRTLATQRRATRTPSARNNEWAGQPPHSAWPLISDPLSVVAGGLEVGELLLDGAVLSRKRTTYSCPPG
jgi:hypothetical protein